MKLPGGMLLDMRGFERLRIVSVNRELALLLAGRRRLSMDTPQEEEAVAAFVLPADAAPEMTAEQKANIALEIIFGGLFSTGTMAMVDASRIASGVEVVAPDEAMMVAAGLAGEVPGEDYGKKYPEPERIVFRMKAGDSGPRDLARLAGRRVLKVEIGGQGTDATIAVITEGPDKKKV